MNEFKQWGTGYSGCDGGDMGGPDTPAVWVCGIEWGGGDTAESLATALGEDVSVPPEGYSHWADNIAYIFNWQIMKLLNAIGGGRVADYKAYAEKEQPFIIGSEGYFKLNLYPIGFKNTSLANWKTEFTEITGFGDKTEYLGWCVENRFPRLREWAKQHQPKLILCLGKTYLEDFGAAFHCHEAAFAHEVIDDRDLYWAVNSEGTLVVVLPFMVNRYGLVKNVSIQKFGERISELLTNPSPRMSSAS